MNITTIGLINLIWSSYDNAELTIDIVQYGRSRGWLEEQDELWRDVEIDRRSAARIIHEFMRIEYNIAEMRDWSNARKLKDLYDCKVCAKHVAQVVEMKIIPPKEETRFRLLDKISLADAEEYVAAMAEYIYKKYIKREKQE